MAEDQEPKPSMLGDNIAAVGQAAQDAKVLIAKVSTAFDKIAAGPVALTIGTPWFALTMTLSIAPTPTT